MVIFHSYVSLPEGIRNEVAFKITAVLSPVLLGKTPMDCGLADYHIPQIHMTKYPQSKSPKNEQIQYTTQNFENNESWSPSLGVVYELIPFQKPRQYQAISLNKIETGTSEPPPVRELPHAPRGQVVEPWLWEIAIQSMWDLMNRMVSNHKITGKNAFEWTKSVTYGALMLI